MSIEQYKDINFRPDTLALIDTLNDIIDGYVAQGFRLTVRQLYYQLVARALIENTERSYKRITSIVNDARMAGLMSWAAIEDRTRDFIRRTRWQSAHEILDDSARGFHMDMWDNQDTRVFVVVEKEALAGVLEGVCQAHDVPLLAARGYPSGTVLREFAIDDIAPAIDHGQCIVILHLGDHDPSGIDMTRDLRERIELFLSSRHDCELNRIALNMDQIRRLRPPPNPAKTTDSRFAEYRATHGTRSWELDALNPEFLAGLVRDAIREHIDPDRWQAKQDEIEAVKTRLAKYAERERKRRS